MALPETKAFGCVLLWNGKICDSGATDLWYGARSNWPFLSTQELEWWLIRQSVRVIDFVRTYLGS